MIAGVAEVARAVIPADIVVTRSAILAIHTYTLVDFDLALLARPAGLAYALVHVHHVVASGVINARLTRTFIDVCNLFFSQTKRSQSTDLALWTAVAGFTMTLVVVDVVQASAVVLAWCTGALVYVLRTVGSTHSRRTDTEVVIDTIVACGVAYARRRRAFVDFCRRILPARNRVFSPISQS